MALNIAKVLNIERKERGVVFLLLVQSIFLGIFAGALDVGANALFLDAYSAENMPKAFMISGVVGIVFTSTYALLQRKLPFRLFTVLNLLLVIVIVAALRAGYSLTDDPRLAFALLVMMGPVIIISMLGFWGTAGRYFTLREGKRLFGIIDTGSVVGMVLAFYAVPVLVRFNFKVYDTLLIGGVSVLAALIFQLIVLQRYKLPLVKDSGSEEIKERTGFFGIFRKRYTSLMAFFVMLSVITGFFVHYSFMWATQANYPDSRELTGFLGAFFGTMMIATVIIKSTLYGWLMKNYGLRVTLLISPALLLILTVIASLVGGIFGYAAEATSFTFFFLVIALSKLFNKSLKDAIESPSMKILYQSLDARERFDVQARIDGIVNEITAFSAGLFMAGLLLLSFVTVIHFSYLLIIVLLLWVFLGYQLNRAYRKTLNDTLSSARTYDSSPGKETARESGDITQSGMYTEILQLDPYAYHYASADSIEALLGHKDDRVRKITWKFISGKMFVCSEGLADQILTRETDPETKRIIDSYNSQMKLPGKKIEEAFRSLDKQVMRSALMQTLLEKDVEQQPHIITLLRDRDPGIRSAAIETAGKIRIRELGSYLVDYLGHRELYATTWSALVNLGDIILENLENSFHKSGVETRVKLRIVRAMAEIGGKRADNYLLNKIDYHQRNIREAAILGLYRNGFSPDERAKERIKSMIYEVAMTGARNIAAEAVIREHNPENGINEAIREERYNAEKLLFMLMGIAFDRNAIEHVQRSIEDEENTDTGFALELLNLIIDEDVFAYIEPYFDDLSAAEKIRRLQNEMPVEMLPYGDLLIDLVNRDSVYTGNYLRTCAIDAIRRDEEIKAGLYLAAQVFNPHPAISIFSREALLKSDPEIYRELDERLKLYGTKLESNKEGSSDTMRRQVLEVVENLKQWKVFENVDREMLFDLALNFMETNENDPSNPARVSFIRDRSDDGILADGLVISIAGHPEFSEHSVYITSDNEVEFYQADRDVFREILFDRPELLYACSQLFYNVEPGQLSKKKINRLI